VEIRLGTDWGTCLGVRLMKDEWILVWAIADWWVNEEKLEFCYVSVCYNNNNERCEGESGVLLFI